MVIIIMVYGKIAKEMDLVIIYGVTKMNIKECGSIIVERAKDNISGKMGIILMVNGN